MTEVNRERRQEPDRAVSTGKGDSDNADPGDYPEDGDALPAADQAVANQERMLETGEENPV